MALQPRESYQRVFQLLKAHHEWFSGALPLIASENIPSPAVKEAILSDFGNRYAEGWTGERVYAGCRYIHQEEDQEAPRRRKNPDARNVRRLRSSLSAPDQRANPDPSRTRSQKLLRCRSRRGPSRGRRIPRSNARRR